MATSKLKIISLNCNGYKSNHHYIDSLLIPNFDIIFLCETWLLDSEKHLLHNYKSDFSVYFTPGKKHHSGRPFGGNTLFIRNSSIQKVDLILKEDYATTVKIDTDSSSYLLTGVYLQSTSSDPDYLDVYQEQINTIARTFKHFEDCCETIVLGDFQSCPTEPLSPRSRKTNSLSHILDEFITDHSLCPIDIKNGTGPTYTYQHATLPNQSYIDHILVSINTIDACEKILVHEPHHLNTGDHLPVSAQIKLTSQIRIPHTPRSDVDFIPNYMWKNSEFINLYKKHLLDSFEDTTSINTIQERIDYLHKSLKNSALNAYAQLKKENTFHFFKAKSWWTSELSEKQKSLRTFFNIWRDQGFPKDENNVTYNRYRFARKIFRNLVKKNQNQRNVQHYINVEKIKETKPRDFWKQLRLNKRYSNQSQKLFTINNKTKSEDIVQNFKEHFSSIFNTPRVEGFDNDRSNNKLNELLSDIKVEVNDFYISDEDIKASIKDLNDNKAFDPFDLKAEHFKSVPPSTVHYITKLINDIMNCDDLPTCLSSSILIPLVKSYQKPLSDGNNYRGISLIPILTKIIEKTIVVKCPSVKQHKNVQFGFTSDASTLHAELLIKDTIQKYNVNGSPVYICSLDAEKAFDTCNWYKLFQSLQQKGTLPNKVIKFLIQLYLKGEGMIRYNNSYSGTFNLSQGVRQGSILAPFLYNLYTEDLIDRVQDLNVGTFLPGNINTSIIAFADDLILMSPTLEHLQRLLDTCLTYGKEHAIKFNEQKTQFVISGQSPLPSPYLTMNSSSVTVKSEMKHLGFKWGMKKDILNLDRHNESRLSELWATTASLLSSGARWYHPSTTASVFQSIVVPKVLYGVEILDINKHFETLLDKQCRNSLKSLWDISKHSRNDLNKYFNLSDLSYNIKSRKINFLKHLMSNQTTRTYLLALLSSNDRSFSTLQTTFNIALNEDIDIISVILGNKVELKREAYLENDKRSELNEVLSNWNPESRAKLKILLESNIPR